MHQTANFYDVSNDPVAKLLKDNYYRIASECLKLGKDDYHDWYEYHLYNHGWKAFPFNCFDGRNEHNINLCPFTWSVINQIPGVLVSGFSLLSAGTHIFPHDGVEDLSNYAKRYHLGLIVPPAGGCSIVVGDQVRSWEAGKVLAFNDSKMHYAQNTSSWDRVVLLVDVCDPDKMPSKEEQDELKDHYEKIGYFKSTSELYAYEASMDHLTDI